MAAAVDHLARGSAAAADLWLERESVAQVAAIGDDARHQDALVVACDQRLDQVVLVHGNEYEDLAAHLARNGSRQLPGQLQMLGRFGGRFCCRLDREEFAQAALGEPRIAFDERIEAGPDAAVGKGHNHRLAHLRVRLEPRRNAGCVVEEPRPLALAVADAQHVAGDAVVELLAGRHPDAGQEALLREHASLRGGERVGRIAPLVLEQVPQVLVSGDAEKPGAAREARGKLEIGEIGAPVAPAQPVLLLGEVVVADAGAMQLAQRRLGRAEEAALAARLGDVERQAIDPAADERIATREQERRRDAELARDRKRTALAREQMARHTKTPPRDFVDPAQHRLDLAGARAEAAALHRGKQVALEHHAARPASLDFARQAHRAYSAAAARSAPVNQRSRSASARRVSARFFASAFWVPRSRSPLSLLTACASGGKRPKLTFIGWYERAGAAPQTASTWPPVICASNAPCAVVGGGGVR